MKRMVTPFSRWFILFLLLCAASSGALAASGKITGRIVDRETREPLPAANVVISHYMSSSGQEVAMDRPLGGSSDIEGYYFILNVSPGTYTLRVSQVGYAQVIKRNIRVESDRTITVDFELSSTAIEVNQVVVTAQRDIVKKDVSATQEVVIPTKMEEMPVVRVDEFVGRLKGVELVSGPEGNGLSVRGGSIRETDVRMDGISLQDPRSENSYMALNSTTIEEIQVLTGGFEAKYGGIRSGLLNVVTKDGSRERYTMSIKADIAPAGQQRFFGTDPYSDQSWIYRVYAGEYAMRGIRTHEDSMAVPQEFWSFKGWTQRIPGTTNANFLDSTQKRDLWLRTHPQYSHRQKIDMFLEGSITGPFPGFGIPILRDYADRTSFMLGFKYENSQLAFPIGPRDNYLDWNTQLKLTSQLADNLRLSINGMYAKIESNSGGGTSNYGGALSDASASFSYLNSTESSVRRQASLLAGTEGRQQMFNKSRLQYYEQKYFVGGARLTNTFSTRGFFTLDFQMGYTNQELAPFALDTSRADAWLTYTRNNRTYRFLNVPALGSPNGSTNTGTDVLGNYVLYGGAQHADSSHSYVYQLKGDMTMQIGRHHQFEAGFSARLQDMFVYSGSWYQAQISFTPDLWQYYKATPLDIGAYVQDKLEFEGMILNAGLRLDYLNPMKKGFLTGFPVTDAYKNFYNTLYLNTPGAWGSYERWLNFRSLLENPPGWPETENKVQAYISPRLGVSFPITDASKMYFNYGHFYQRPPAAFMYNQNIYIGSVAVPTPDLKMARTVSYEFGYEQMLFNDFVVNVAAYYKDNRNEPLARTFVNYYGDNTVIQYFPDAYSDIRGVELRLERPVGTFLTFYGMYDYSLYSGGQSGLANVYENRLQARTEIETRPASLYTNDPRPRANFTVNFHTPRDFGPELGGMNILGRWVFDLFFEWRSNGRYLSNPEVSDVKDRIYIDAINYWNMDFRGSKMFDIGVGELELVLTVKNLTNNKWLTVGNMTRDQLIAYKASLQPGDKWGQYKSDDNHIKLDWWEAPLFLNPRMILLGARLNF
ncbi:MAG: carboxypeptidase-like regulatory domain-containing protein [Acidobacteriota bacterium]